MIQGSCTLIWNAVGTEWGEGGEGKRKRGVYMVGCMRLGTFKAMPRVQRAFRAVLGRPHGTPHDSQPLDTGMLLSGDALQAGL